MLELKELSFSYKSSDSNWFRRGSQDQVGIRGINLVIPDGVCLGVIGASGSGKSTLLKLIGGHHFPDSGKIFQGGQDISRLEPGHRDVITVFQDHALFPHLTVYQNVEFPLNLERQLGQKEKELLVMEYLERLSISHLKNKKPVDLSGGERQRTALARALVTKRSVLLLDEPTASLDAVQKNELTLLLNETEDWPVKPAIILVTHDHEFAVSLCRDLAILDHGSLIAHGATREIVFFPPNVPAAKILNNHAVVIGRVDTQLQFSADKDDSLAFTLPEKFSSWRNRRCVLLVRSDVIHIGSESLPDQVVLTGRVHAVQFYGMVSRVVLDVRQHRFKCDLSKSSYGNQFSHKEEVKMSFSLNDIQLVDAESSEHDAVHQEILAR